MRSTRAKACRISRCPAKAARRGICRCIRARRASFTNISKPPATAPMKTAPCSVRSGTTAPASSTRRSRPTVSTSWCAPTRPLLGFEIGAHALRATAATNALDHEADIAKVQEWLGHANISHHPPLRSPPHAAGGQPDIQGGLLTFTAGTGVSHLTFAQKKPCQINGPLRVRHS